MKVLISVTFIISSLLLNAQNIPLYVGTYTGEGSEGIYYYSFNEKTGELSNKTLAVKTTNPSFLAYSKNRKYIYAVGEVANYNMNNSGFVSAFSVAKNGKLTLINTVSSNGANPCHIEVNDKHTAISNYSGGTVSIHKIKKNGRIEPAYQIIDHTTPNKTAHTHSSKFVNNSLFIADLGRNFLSEYTKKNNTYVLKEHYLMAPKAGPRHFKITKNKQFIYVMNEYSSTITVLKRTGKGYVEIQNANTLAEDFKGENAGADLHLSKNETYLYGSNRGENSIVVFKRDAVNGTLKKIQNSPVMGNWPRNFTISPNGKFLLVANKYSKNISVFKIDKATGKLNFIYSIEAPTPVCLLF